MRITGKLIGGKVLTAVAAVALVGSLGLPTNAQAVACLDGTLASLLALPAAGCTSQDKTFSNFSYSGAVTDPATSIAAHLIFQPGVGQDIHGWSFTNSGVNGAWTSGFTLSFTIAVTPGNPLNPQIIGSKDQIDSGFTPNGTVVNDTQSAPAGLLTVNGTSTNAETVQKSYAGVTSITTSAVATVPAGSLLVKLDQEFAENVGTLPGIPEPTTLLLLGSGLAGLAGWRRWHAQKA